jgi:2-iminobutanoate/2-iminopropanoate deaminase
MTNVKRIETDKAPRPGGHYAQGTVGGGMLYVAGQLPILPDGTHRADAEFDEQAEIALRNMLGIVEASGSGAKDILKVTVYIVGIENWPKFNGVFARVFGDVFPARAVVPVPELHYGYLVEVDAVALAK